MAKWIDRSHPQVTTGAVVLGYITGVMTFLSSFSQEVASLSTGFRSTLPIIAIALVGGAYGTANNKKIGHFVLAVAAVVRVAFLALTLATVVGGSNLEIVFTLRVLSASVFPVALLAAVLHSQTLHHRKVWFE